MKKALIDPAGRLIQVEAQEFPVAEPFQWVDVADTVSTETHEWSGTAVVAKPPLPLPAVKAQKLAELLKAREAAEQANVTVQGKVFSADPKIADKFEKLASRLRRGKASKLTAILTVDGTPVQVTQQLLEQIEDAIADQTETVWNKYGTLVAQVNAATTAAQVQAITW